MDDRPPDRSPRWRARIRLSVRVLMVLILVFGGVLGWLMHRARVQREAVAAIERMGGIVYYDESFLGPSEANAPRAPLWKRWLVDHLGIDYFENVHLVSFQPDARSQGQAMIDSLMAKVGKLAGLKSIVFERKNQVTNAGPVRGAAKLQGRGLAHLMGLSRLETLVLDELDLSDDDVSQLAGLTSLNELWISGSRISDGGLAPLEKLTNLESLSVSNSQNTSAGLVHLRGLSHLKYLALEETRVESLEPLKRATTFSSLSNLDLAGTPIDDAGLAPVAECLKLTSLDLSRTRISDKGLVQVAKLPSLRELSLDKTALTDAGVLHLAGLTELRELSLNDTRITDACLLRLTALSKCHFLSVTGTDVTERGIATLKKILPAMQIDH